MNQRLLLLFFACFTLMLWNLFYLCSIILNRMKNLLLLVSFLTLLIGEMAMVIDRFPSAEAVISCSGVEETLNALPDNDYTGEISSVDEDYALAGMALASKQTMERQLNMRSERFVRFSLLQNVLFSKVSVHCICMHEALLTIHYSHRYSTMRCINWDCSPQHYVFAMRRILI